MRFEKRHCKKLESQIGTFLFVKNKFQKKFANKINRSKDKQIYLESVIVFSFEEISAYSETEKCDYSGKPFREGEEITKYWILKHSMKT